MKPEWLILFTIHFLQKESHQLVYSLRYCSLLQRIERSFLQPKSQDRTTTGQGANNNNNANDSIANNTNAISQQNSDHSPNKRF